MHYRAQWLWEHSRGERQRNMAASIRGLAREKKVQEQSGNASWGLGGCQGHLRELSGEADLWRTLLTKPISQHVSLWVCVCVLGADRSAVTPMHAVMHALTPWMLRLANLGTQVQRSELKLSHTENQMFSNVYSKHEMKQRIKNSRAVNKKGETLFSTAKKRHI